MLGEVDVAIQLMIYKTLIERMLIFSPMGVFFDICINSLLVIQL